MPQRGPAQPYDVDEFAAARAFVVEHVGSSFGTTFESVDGTKLVASENGSKWAVHMAPSQNGAISLLVNPSNGQFFESSPGHSGVLIVDPNADLVYGITNDRLSEIFAGQYPATHVQVVDSGGWRQLVIHQPQTVCSKVVPCDDPSFGSDRAKVGVSEDFVHLHCHSMYSLLDGAQTIEGMVARARANGQPGLALTDHGVMFGTYKFYNTCKDQGIKPILGVEAYLVDDVSKKYQDANGHTVRFEHHITLLAMNQTGWQNLCLLMSLACRDHMYYVPRIDHELLFKHSEGIICLTGCFKGPIAHYLQHYENPERPWMNRNPDLSRQWLKRYKEVFGDRLYGEAMNIDFHQYMRIVPELLQLFDDEGVPATITNDCHYERGEDRVLQVLLSAMSTSSVDSLAENDTGVYYIRERHEMLTGQFTAAMADRTCEIADRCNVDLDFTGYLFPQYKLEEDVDWAAYQEAGHD